MDHVQRKEVWNMAETLADACGRGSDFDYKLGIASLLEAALSPYMPFSFRITVDDKGVHYFGETPDL